MKRGWSVHLFLGYVLCGLTLTCTLAISPPASAQTTKPAKKATTEKKSAYMGDPARKRGLELGYDYGLKAGKEDKAKNKKLAPQDNEVYKNPDKFYRYEFGSRANFNSGFKSGFLGGYQQAFGKKVPLKADGTISGVPTPGTTTVKKTKGAPPPPANPSADAL